MNQAFYAETRPELLDGVRGRGRPGVARGRAACAHPAFTLIEMLVAISIIALLAGMVVGGAALAKRAGRESRIRAEMNQLITAIESYKEATGQYPPDNGFGVKNPAQVPLYYELAGVLARPEGGAVTYRTKDSAETISSQDVARYFGVEGFANTAIVGPGEDEKSKAREVRSFIKLSSQSQRRAIGKGTQGEDVQALVVSGAPWPLGPITGSFPPPVAGTEYKTVNPWRYVAAPYATNNPNSFDLWAEFVDGNELKIICNWSSDIIVRKRP